MLLKSTLTAVLKSSPVSSITVPTSPESGVKVTISQSAQTTGEKSPLVEQVDGAHARFVVPTLTVMGPCTVPIGTVAIMALPSSMTEDVASKSVLLGPVKRTAVSVPKFSPLINMVLPKGALGGPKEVIEQEVHPGGGGGGGGGGVGMEIVSLFIWRRRVLTVALLKPV